MKGKIAATFVILLFIIQPAHSYTYYEGSRYFNETSAIYDITLDEGVYSLVFDNSGYMGNENTNAVTVDIEITFFGDDSVDPLEQTITVQGSDWSYYRFSFESSSSVDTLQINIDASDSVSFFLADDSNRNEFGNEVDEYTQNTIEEDNQDSESDGNGLFILLIIGAIIVGIVIYSNKDDKEGQEKNSQNKVSNDLNQESYCQNCGDLGNSKFCSKCGQQRY